MTGTAATRALRANGFAGLIIGMTGDPAGCPERSEFEAAGLDGCLDKDTKAMNFLLGLLKDIACTANGR